MKKILIVTCLAIAGLFYGNEGYAQVRVNVNVNIGSQPLWGPVGYDYAEYYYLPDVDAYYYVPEQRFIYLNGGRWIFAPSLPSHYHYDLNRGYKVVVNEPKPYLHPDVYRNKYGRYKGKYGKQQIIRYSNDEKYYQVKGHSKNGNYKEGKGNNGKGNNGKGNNGKGNNGKGHGKKD